MLPTGFAACKMLSPWFQTLSFECINHRLEREFIVTYLPFLNDSLTAYKSTYGQESVFKVRSEFCAANQTLLLLLAAPAEDLEFFTSASITFFLFFFNILFY